MPQQFITFKTFNDPETAKDFTEVLEQNNIPFKIEEDMLNFDPSYVNHPLNKDYRVKIFEYDFERANLAYEQFYESKLDLVDKDYYLFGFSDDELIDIISKPDEWGHFDYLLAQKMLTHKGKAVTKEDIRRLKSERLTEVSKPEKTDKGLIFLGYVMCAFFAPGGLFIGSLMAFSKKTIFDGNQLSMYNSVQRKHGKIILIISIILTSLYVLGAITNNTSLWFWY